MNLNLKIAWAVIASITATVSIAAAEPETCAERFETPAAALAERIGRLVNEGGQRRRETSGFDASGLILDYIRQHQGGADQIERALRARGVPIYLMAVHRSRIRNADQSLRGPRAGDRSEFYVHISAEGPAIAEAHRRLFEISDEAQNLERLKRAGYLVTQLADADLSADVARYVRQLNHDLEPFANLAGLPLAREFCRTIERNVFGYLDERPDVTPMRLEMHLRAAASPVYLVAVARTKFGENATVIPLGGRPPSNPDYVLEVHLATPDSIFVFLKQSGISAAENLRRLGDVGRLGPNAGKKSLGP